MSETDSCGDHKMRKKPGWRAPEWNVTADVRQWEFYLKFFIFFLPIITWQTQVSTAKIIVSFLYLFLLSCPPN